MAFAVIRAAAEEHFHGFNHGFGAHPPFSLTLRKQVHVLDLGTSEQLSCTVWAGSNTGAAANTSCCVERLVSRFFGNRDQVGVGCRPGVDRDVATGHDDGIEGRAIDRKILDDRERCRTERFDHDGVAIGVLAHV